MDSRSDWFRAERAFDLDRIRNHAEENVVPLWSGKERPPDPMAWRVREVLSMLKPEHSKLLEDRFFLNKTTAEIARERGVTDRVVRRTLERAKDNFAAAMARSTIELAVVPTEAL